MWDFAFVGKILVTSEKNKMAPHLPPEVDVYRVPHLRMKELVTDCKLKVGILKPYPVYCIV